MGKGRRNRLARSAIGIGPANPIPRLRAIGGETSSKLLRLQAHEPQKGSVRGICALCLREVELVLVSVLPDWAFVNVSDPNRPRWYLLCAECDTILKCGEADISLLGNGSFDRIEERGIRVANQDDLTWTLSGKPLAEVHFTLLGMAFKYDQVAHPADRMPKATQNGLRDLLIAHSLGTLRTPFAIKWYSFDLMAGTSPRDYVGVQSFGSVNGLAPHSEVSLDGMKWIFQTSAGAWLDSVGQPVIDWTVLIGDGRANATWFADFEDWAPSVRESWASLPSDGPCPCGSTASAAECCAKSWLSLVPPLERTKSIFQPAPVCTGLDERLGPDVVVERTRALRVVRSGLPAGLGSDRRTGGVQGKCILCGNETALRLSHVHPRWSFLEMKREGSVLHQPSGADWANQMQDGYKHYLLCQQCEEFLGEGENALRRISYSSFDELASNGLDVALGADREWRVIGRNRFLIQRALLGIALKYHYAPSARFAIESAGDVEVIRSLLVLDKYDEIEPPRAIKWYTLGDRLDANPRAVSMIAFGSAADRQAHLSEMIGGMTWYTSLVPAERAYERRTDWVVSLGPLRANAFLFDDWEKAESEIDIQAAWRVWDRKAPCPCGSGKLAAICCAGSWLRILDRSK